MAVDPLYKKIGSIIRTRRNALGFKQETLAAELRISRGALANIETGRQGILVHQLYKFAAALKIAPTDLLPHVPTNPIEISHADLPVPSDLKMLQKEQVARFFGQITTAP